MKSVSIQKVLCWQGMVYLLNMTLLTLILFTSTWSRHFSSPRFTVLKLEHGEFKWLPEKSPNLELNHGAHVVSVYMTIVFLWWKWQPCDTHLSTGLKRKGRSWGNGQHFVHGKSRSLLFLWALVLLNIHILGKHSVPELHYSSKCHMFRSVHSTKQ